MEAVSDYHNVEVGVHLTLPQVQSRGRVRVTAVATRRGSVPTGVRPSVSRSALIGSTDPVKDTALIFRLIHDLDRDCGQMWAQAGLFESV
jgi:hypothetical protein